MTPPPLPTVAVPADDGAAVFITGDRAKLPADVLAMLDPASPVPPGVQFFEKEITLGGVLSAAAWSVGLGAFGILCVIFGLAVLIRPTGPVTVSSGADWAPLGFGVVCVFAAWMMAGSVMTQLRLRGEQRAGRPTRVGIFLTPGTLIESASDAWCVLPRASVRGVSGGRLTYTLKAQEKSIRLPAQIIGANCEALELAVRRWLVG